MGHLSAVGHTVEEALERVKLATNCMSRKAMSA